MLQKLSQNIPIVIVVLALLINHQLGSERFPMVLVTSTIACIAIFVLTKRISDKTISTAADAKIKSIERENKNLKDNLMKVYTMLEQSKKEPGPPQHGRGAPGMQEEQPKVEEIDSKPYA